MIIEYFGRKLYERGVDLGNEADCLALLRAQRMWMEGFEHNLSAIIHHARVLRARCQKLEVA
jgi:hypothetical protein